MKCIVHLGLQRPTVNAANESCGQTLPTILVLVISLVLFLSSPLKPNCLEYRNSFPAFLASFHALSASAWIGIERIQQSRWILSGSLASSTMTSQRQRCCTFSKNLHSFASLANIFQLCSCPLDSASTSSENDENHGLGAQAGGFQRNFSISELKLRLARSSGVSPRLKANLSPKIRIE